MNLRLHLLTCALVAVTMSVAAQPLVRVTAIHAVRNEPQATARLSIRCNGESAHGITASNLTLVENGTPVSSFSITASPSDDTRKPFDVMLALDISGSMMGAGNLQLIAAGLQLVQYIDTTTDRIGIVLFNQVATLHQDFTNDTSMLNTKISAIPAQGATAVYDGAWMALQSLIAQNDTTAEAVILMTDGGDNSSAHTPGEVIALAQQYGKRIHAIALGISAPTPILQMFADSTGGLFFNTPDASELALIFTDIASFMRAGYDEYTISYRVPDPSADRRILEISATAPPCDGVGTGSTSRPARPAVTHAASVPTREVFALESITPQPVSGGVAHLRVTMHEATGMPLVCTVFDMLGRRTMVQRTAVLGAGTHAVQLDLRGLPPGVYFVRMQVGEQSLTRSLLLDATR